MAEKATLYCCGCGTDVEARLTDGREVYSHRRDLHSLPFWKCDACGNFVGCHHRTKERTRPLGCIPTKEIKVARQHIHKILDPLWKQNRIRRGDLYSMLAEKLGIEEYHTAEIRSVDEARKVYGIVQEIARTA